MPSVAWFIAGVFATGSFWYFLSKRDIVGAASSGIGALIFVALAIHLHRRCDKAIVNAPHIQRLAELLDEAHALRARLVEIPLPVTDHNAWVARVVAYLRSDLSHAHEVRFSDFSGMTFYGDGSERSAMSRSLEGRSRRLNEFIVELGR